MATEFGTGKTVFILTIVVGCFAILWPKIFYPMLQESVSSISAPSSSITVQGTDCCDVISEKDVNAIKIMTELCQRILTHQDHFDKKLVLTFQQGKSLTKETINRCKIEVLNKCNIDITSFLAEKVRLGRSYKQILDDIRSVNSSLCLKVNFGVNPSLLGTPRYMRIWSLTQSKHLRQERPPHLRPEMLHPALREKGRAIPQSSANTKVIEKEGRPPPIPGMRPPMGGAGHVVPAPKGGSTMGIIMPMYTVGIVIFFMYTMMKLLFKKSDETNAYKEFTADPEFRRVVFNEADYYPAKTSRKTEEENNTKLEDIELDQLRRRLAETEAAMERIVKLVANPQNSENLKKEPESEKAGGADKTAVKDQVDKDVDIIETENKGGIVQVVGMEMTESCEGGHRWSRPSTPILNHHPNHTPTTIPLIPVEPAQEIFLEGSLPLQSHLLVSQSEVLKLPLDEDNNDASVILTGKVTLSLIGVDSESIPNQESSVEEDNNINNLQSLNDKSQIDVVKEILATSQDFINNENLHEESLHQQKELAEDSKDNKEEELMVEYEEDDEEEEEEEEEEDENEEIEDVKEDIIALEKVNNLESIYHRYEDDEAETEPINSQLDGSLPINYNGNHHHEDVTDEQETTKYITAPLDGDETVADYSEIETTTHYNTKHEDDEADNESEDEEKLGVEDIYDDINDAVNVDSYKFDTLADEEDEEIENLTKIHYDEDRAVWDDEEQNDVEENKINDEDEGVEDADDIRYDQTPEQTVSGYEGTVNIDDSKEENVNNEESLKVGKEVEYEEEEEEEEEEEDEDDEPEVSKIADVKVKDKEIEEVKLVDRVDTNQEDDEYEEEDEDEEEEEQLGQDTKETLKPIDDNKKLNGNAIRSNDSSKETEEDEEEESEEEEEEDDEDDDNAASSQQHLRPSHEHSVPQNINSQHQR